MSSYIDTFMQFELGRMLLFCPVVSKPPLRADLRAERCWGSRICKECWRCTDHCSCEDSAEKHLEKPCVSVSSTKLG